MAKEYNLSKTQYLRLQGYLYDLHQSGKVCVFADLSGHVDWLEIRVVDSKRDYDRRLYDKTIYIASEYAPEQTDKELVTSIIADIDEAVLNKEVRLKELQEALEVAEKTKYEELKAKFEGEL